MVDAASGAGGQLDRSNTAIVVDSTADLPPYLRDDPNVTMVPLQVHFGDEVYRDWIDLDPDRFYGLLRSAPKLPTTSQPSVGAFLTEYRRLREHYKRVYSLHLSVKLSGTYSSADVASGEIDGVVVMDTKSASLGISLLVDRLLALLDEGTSAEQFEALVTRYHRDSGFLFTLDTLEYLQKGGRIGRASSLAGGLLNVKPLLTLVDGEVTPHAKVRGERKALAAVREYFLERTRPGVPVAVGYGASAAPEKAEAFAAIIRDTDRELDERFVGEIGAVIGTYAGPGAAVLVFLQE